MPAVENCTFVDSVDTDKWMIENPRFSFSDSSLVICNEGNLQIQEGIAISNESKTWEHIVKREDKKIRLSNGLFNILFLFSYH